jgi:hypothetical protein
MKRMTEEEKRVRIVVQDELLGILADAHEQLGVKKDPTGMARKALDGLSGLIRSRQEALKAESE